MLTSGTTVVSTKADALSMSLPKHKETLLMSIWEPFHCCCWVVNRMLGLLCIFHKSPMMQWSSCSWLNRIWSGQDYTAFACPAVCGHNSPCSLPPTGLFLRLGPLVVSPAEWGSRCGLWNVKCSSLSLSLWLTCLSMNVKVPNLCLRDPVTVVPALEKQLNTPQRKLSCYTAASKSLMNSMTGNTRALLSVRSPVEEVSAKCFCAGCAAPLQVYALQLTTWTCCFSAAV